MKRFGKNVREINYPYELNNDAHAVWCAHESTIYYCEENGMMYILEWGKRKPIECKTPDDVTNYYLQFVMEDD